MAPLEEAVSKNRSSSGHHVDNERERTYNLAGSVDAQIKLLAQDLREVWINITYQTQPLNECYVDSLLGYWKN